MKNCTRFFTQEQIDEIRMRLAAINGAKDSLFEPVEGDLKGNEKVAIIQDGKNKLCPINKIGGATLNIDSIPTEDSLNLVYSGGIYLAIEDVRIGFIRDKCFIRIDSEGAMAYSLENGPTTQTVFNLYWDTLYDAVVKEYLVILDTYIGYPEYDSDSQTLYIVFKTELAIITWGARKEEDDWIYLSDSGRVTNTIVRSNTLNSRLNNYYTKSEINTINNGILVSITNVSNALNLFKTEIQGQLQSIPKYHKANWLIDEVDQNGIRKDSTDRDPVSARWEGIWNAAKGAIIQDSEHQGTSSGTSRLLIMYNIPATYMWTDSVVSKDSATTVIVKFFNGDVITTYTILKKQDDGTIYTPEERQMGYSTYLKISKSEAPVVPEDDPTFYNVTYNLVSCTSSNITTRVRGNYDTTLDVFPFDPEGLGIRFIFEPNSITVTMGEVDITSQVVSITDASATQASINIPQVTGDIVITATATDSDRV